MEEEARLARVRPGATKQRYGRWQAFWEDWCAGAQLDPLTFTLAKWYKFVEWLDSRTKDRDLNAVRSALNRMFNDEGRGRPFVGVDVSAVISDWATQKDEQRRAAGEEVGLHRVPCPEVALVRVFAVGETTRGEALAKAALLIVMMLFWLRGASVAGFEAGDVYFEGDSVLCGVIRYVKKRPEFRSNPAKIRVRAPTQEQRERARRRGQRHVRDRAFAIVRRAERELGRGWLTLVSDQCTPQARNGEDAARKLTEYLREICPQSEMNLARGETVSAHSIREMAALHTYLSGGSETHAVQRGLWKTVQTMWTNYIMPYLHWPRSELLEELYDDIPRQ